MSLHTVHVIPERVGDVPDEAAIERARRELESVPDLSSIEVEHFDGLQLVDAGQRFESVHCPSCGADADAWWADAMDRAWVGTCFDDLSCTTPCCGARTTLHDLVYRGPQGFARFELRAHNHNGQGDFHLAPDGRIIGRRKPGRVAPFVFTGVQIVSPRLIRDWPEGPFSTNVFWDRAIEAGRAYGLVHQGLWSEVNVPGAIARTEALLADG